MSGIYLRQSTASQSRAIGPLLDDTDFKSAETGLTIAASDIKLVVNGGASANKNSGGGTHRVNGIYGVTFDATDTATVGEVEVSVVVAGALPVFHKFYVLEEAIYDALFAASAAAFDSSARVLLQPTQTGVTIPTVTTLTGHTAQTGDSFARIGATGSGLTSLASQTSLNTLDDLVDTEVAAIKTVVDSILVDTAEIGATGAGLTSLATQASVNTIDDLLDTEVAAIKSDTAAIITAVADVPTNAELATALGTADDAVLAAIAALNNLSSAQAQTAAAAALSAYDPPTRAEATTDKDAVIAAIPLAATVAAAVQSSASSNPLAANVKEINDVLLEGTGTLGDEFGPA